MKSRPLSLKTICRNLLIAALFALGYYAIDTSTSYLLEQHAATLHGAFVGGGILLALLGLLIAWAEQTRSLNGQKKPLLAALLPLGFFVGMGAGMSLFGLSYWMGKGFLTIAAGLSMLAGILMVGVSMLYENRLKKMA